MFLPAYQTEFPETYEASFFRKHFKAAGCNAAFFVGNSYDDESTWVGLTGTPEQIAATYDQFHNCGRRNTLVLYFMDLTPDLKEEQKIPGLSISAVYYNAIAAHDRDAFDRLPPQEKINRCAQMLDARDLPAFNRAREIAGYQHSPVAPAQSTPA